MAKAKKQRALNKYIALRSDCGSADQLCAFDAGTFATIEAARKACVENSKDCSIEGESGGTYVVAEIIDTGEPGDLHWSGKVSIS